MSDWLQDPAMVGYSAYTERFADDLHGVAEHLPYLDELGVRYLHLMHLLRPRVRARGRLVHLHASVETSVGPVDDPGVLVTVREHPVGRFVGVSNVTPETRPWPGWRVNELGVADSRDEITGAELPWGDDGDVWLPPYAVLWLTSDRPWPWNHWAGA